MFNKTIFNLSILLGIILLSGAAQADRFKGTQFKDCCLIGDKSKCQKLNQQAQDSGCISEAEKNSLDSIPAVVTCDGVELVISCKCSCFSPSTRILVQGKETGSAEWISLRELSVSSEAFYVKVLENISSIEHPTFKLLSFNITECDATQVLVMNMTDSTQLKVTAEHPVLLPSGEIARADSLSSGDRLLNYLGQPIQIQTITEEMSDGGVMNVEIVAEPDISHTIVAEGYLVGDSGSQRALLQSQIL